MKILSVRQPWTWALVYAGKDIENRTWYADYRGPVALHAGKTMTKDSVRQAMFTFNMAEVGHFHVSKCERGGIIGWAQITGCQKNGAPGSRKSVWAVAGCYGFHIERPKPLPFIETLGSLGLCELSKERFGEMVREEEERRCRSPLMRPPFTSMELAQIQNVMAAF
jgi:hypothetical protein